MHTVRPDFNSKYGPHEVHHNLQHASPGSGRWTTYTAYGTYVPVSLQKRKKVLSFINRQLFRGVQNDLLRTLMVVTFDEERMVTSLTQPKKHPQNVHIIALQGPRCSVVLRGIQTATNKPVTIWVSTAMHNMKSQQRTTGRNEHNYPRFARDSLYCTHSVIFAFHFISMNVCG